MIYDGPNHNPPPKRRTIGFVNTPARQAVPAATAAKDAIGWKRHPEPERQWRGLRRPEIVMEEECEL